MGKSELSNEFIKSLDRIKEGLFALLNEWWAANHRSFPWRIPDISPYHILIAEVLLKRTTATAAAKAFNKLTQRYSSIESLARANQSELEDILSCVGLQKQRARGLIEIVQYILEQEGGIIPSDLDRLLNIPHIGQYSARAIQSFAFNVPSAVVDSNVVRVIGRIFSEELTTSSNPGLIQKIVDRLIPKSNHKEFNWAMLDFGALVCRYGEPRCEKCPFEHICSYVL